NEVRRIAAECRERRSSAPTNGKATMVTLGMAFGQAPAAEAKPQAALTPEQLLTPPNRRWYPVIDYSRCTNCLECLDFCLFGGDVKDALGQAVLERDRELVADGRQAVGMAVGIPKRQVDKPQGPKDDLDNLMDQLDALDL